MLLTPAALLKARTTRPQRREPANAGAAASLVHVPATRGLRSSTCRRVSSCGERTHVSPSERAEGALPQAQRQPLIKRASASRNGTSRYFSSPVATSSTCSFAEKSERRRTESAAARKAATPEVHSSYKRGGIKRSLRAATLACMPARLRHRWRHGAQRCHVQTAAEEEPDIPRLTRWT
jgi:hypothetical protein